MRPENHLTEAGATSHNIVTIGFAIGQTRDTFFDMIIKLPRLPLKFLTPDGEMEITVRPSPKENGANDDRYCGTASFITHGPRALERIRLTANLPSYTEVRHALLNGFKVRVHEEGTLDYRVMKALLRLNRRQRKSKSLNPTEFPAGYKNAGRNQVALAMLNEEFRRSGEFFEVWNN